MDDLSLPVNMSALDVSLSQVSYVYDGNEKKPAVTVKDGAILLEEGVDYSVNYRDNTNAGTAAVILTGLGDYEGTREETFTISKADPGLLFAQDKMVKSLTDAAFINALSCTTDGAVTFSSSNTAVASVNSSTGQVTIRSAGTTTITASAAEGINYIAGSAHYTLEVREHEKINLADGYKIYWEWGASTNPTYTGKEHCPEIIVGKYLESELYGDWDYQSQIDPIENSPIRLEENLDYTVSYSNNVNPGTATVTVTGIGDYFGTLTINFTIWKIEIGDVLRPGLVYPLQMIIKGTQSASFINLLEKKTDGRVTFSSEDPSVATVDSSSGEVTICGAGTTKITAYAQEGTYYQAGSVSYSILVTDKEDELPDDAQGSGALGNNLYWSITRDGTLTISGTGEMQSDVFCYGSPWSKYLDSISKVVISEGITSIASMFGAGSASEIVLPSTLKTIGSYAFEGCVNLLDISLPEGLTKIETFTFEGCSSLSQITIPDTVTSIGDGAFYECTSLSEIHLPSNLRTIGGNAFIRCGSLTQIEIPAGTESIGYSAFRGCSSLKSFRIPEGVKVIEGLTFADCVNMTSLIIPESVTDIKQQAFQECGKLTIYGVSGSYAETYASDSGISFRAIPSVSSSVITLSETSFIYDDRKKSRL